MEKQEAIDVGVSDGTLTPEQIENWRKVLCTMFGPYALIMPDSRVQEMRDIMQRKAYELADSQQAEQAPDADQ